MQAQPNKWSCLPTAFANIIKVPVSDFITQTGHDGSEIIWSELAPPRCYRGWHIQEMIHTCLRFGWAVTPFERRVYSAPTKGIQPYEIDYNDIFFWYIANTSGVVAVTDYKGHGHALSYADNHLFNPATGLETSLKSFILKDMLWIVNRIRI